MKKLKFSTKINAPKKVVYKNMLEAENYKKWTSAFNPTSYYEGNWKKGETIYFLGIEEDGSRSGMLSRIEENIPNEFISIQHIGIVKKNDEITSGEEVEKWTPAFENYFFSEIDGITTLKVEMDSNEEYKEYFETVWPKAFEILKKICET